MQLLKVAQVVHYSLPLSDGKFGPGAGLACLTLLGSTKTIYYIFNTKIDLLDTT